MAHIPPAAIMFSITIIFAAMFFIPATKYPRKNKLINFYWSGFWIYLAFIASIAGAANTLWILRYDTMSLADAILTGVSASFVVFVMFAWLRLSGSVFFAAIKHFRKKFAQG
ncbi:MAG: hypothetical protein ABJG88_12420 [Litorimonas sp.]